MGPCNVSCAIDPAVVVSALIDLVGMCLCEETIHKVNAKHRASLGVTSRVETGERPIQNDGGAEDALQPAHADKCESMMFNADFHNTNQTGQSGNTRYCVRDQWMEYPMGIPDNTHR